MDKSDSSQNTNLHYACAYGWYFSAKLLVDVGADPDAKNEWKLTPLAISLLKGHQGMAKWLLELPGVDVNGRDDKGRSVIMKMIFEAIESTKEYSKNEDFKNSSLTNDLLNEVIELIEVRKADPTLVDHEGRNILHYLSSWNLNPFSDSSDNPKMRQLITQRHKQQITYMKKFLEYNTDPWTMDENGDWPLGLALSVPCSDFGRNYPIIDLLIEAMKKTTSKNSVTFKKNKTNILMRFATGFSIAFIEKEKVIFDSIIGLLRNFPWKEMVDDRLPNSHHTALISLCFKYAGFSRVTLDSTKGITVYSLLPNLSFDMDGLQKEYLLNWKKAREILQIFIKTFKPSMTYDVDVGKKDKPKLRTISAALAILGTENSNEPFDEKDGLRAGFRMILQHTSMVDCPGSDGKTHFFRAATRGHEKIIKCLITAGADVNVSCKSKSREFIQSNGCKKIIEPYTFPLAEAIKVGNFNIVKLLLNHGACLQPSCSKIKLSNGKEITDPNVFLLAVELCKKYREDRARLSILKELMNHGADINSRFSSCDPNPLMNGLHLALSNSEGRADEALDLEITLIRNKINVFGQSYGRYPLHELFRSPLQKPETKDPIELCSVVVQAMEGKNVNKLDDIGRSALHYAAFCGATISCLLLIDHGKVFFSNLKQIVINVFHCNF